MMSEIEAGKQGLEEAGNVISATEGRLAQSSSRIQDLEEEVTRLRHQYDIVLQNLQSLQSEHDALKDEYRAMSEDLEVMVKENQVVSSQLASVRQGRDKATEELRSAHSSLINTEQAVRIKETELEDLRQAYEVTGASCSATCIEKRASIRR